MKHGLYVEFQWQWRRNNDPQRDHIHSAGSKPWHETSSFGHSNHRGSSIRRPSACPIAPECKKRFEFSIRIEHGHDGMPISSFIRRLSSCELPSRSSSSPLSSGSGPGRRGSPCHREVLDLGRPRGGPESVRRDLKDHPDDDRARFGLGTIQFAARSNTSSRGSTGTDCNPTSPAE